MSDSSFPCPACGAPVIPEAGQEVMACPYCDTTLTIPPKLRRKKSESAVRTETAAPKSKDPFSAAASVRLDEKSTERSKRESELLTGALRSAQPIARGAARLYNCWVLAKYFLPGILIFLAITCSLACIASIVLGLFLGQKLG